MSGSIIDGLRAQVMQRVETLKSHAAMAELLKLHAALNQVEDVEGIQRTNIGQLFGLDAMDSGGVTANGSTPKPTLVVPGQFLGRPALEAAKEFLKLRGKPATLDEIIAGLITGTCEPGKREKLRVSLSRSTFAFVKLGEDVYGLLDWYPEVKKQRLENMSKKPKIAAADEKTAESKADE